MTTNYLLVGFAAAGLLRYFTGWPIPVEADDYASICAFVIAMAVLGEWKLARDRKRLLDLIGEVRGSLR